MTENSSTETLPCGHTRVDHLLQRVELVDLMADASGIEIPEGLQDLYHVISILTYVTGGRMDENATMAVSDIAYELAKHVFPDSTDFARDFAQAVIDASEAARNREEALQADAAL